MISVVYNRVIGRSYVLVTGLEDGRWELTAVYSPSECPWMQTFVAERGIFDDQATAISRALRVTRWLIMLGVDDLVDA